MPTSVTLLVLAGDTEGNLPRHCRGSSCGSLDAQGSLACCSPWGHKEWDTTETLNRPSGGSSSTRDLTHVSAFAGRFFTTEPPVAQFLNLNSSFTSFSYVLALSLFLSFFFSSLK